MTSRMVQALIWAATSVVLLTAVTAVGRPVAARPSFTQVDGTSPLSEAQTDLTLRPPPTPDPQSPSPEPRSPSPEPEAAAEQHVDPQGEPTRVVIPAIDVDADLVRLGLKADGAMQVPNFGLAGWYTKGPKPGHAGPAVIAAHVDSRAGPDVFYRLGDLATGDEVHVVYESGDKVTFLVASSEQTPKDQLPVDAIWPATNERLLTLVTCGGEFDPSAGHYRDNLIVYASLS